MLTERLRERREEIEAILHHRVQALSELPAKGGPEYAEGLRTAVEVGLDYGIEAIEHGEASPPPVPDALLAQARLAARSRVSFDIVLRRYFAAHTVISDCIAEEAAREGLGSVALKLLLRSQAATVDHLLAAVSAAYTEEAENRLRTAEQRRGERIERLLAGEPLDATELGYNLEGHHLGLVASGSRAAEAIAALARSLDARSLVLNREDGAVWAWLGRRDTIDIEEACRLIVTTWPPQAGLAVGEPGEGPGGWRLTHRQARAAFLIALRNPCTPVRYADVALLASMLQDDLLVTSLRRLYLEPLEAERDGGATLRQTLHAYFVAQRNVSSTAASLRVNRKTVTARLRAIECRLDRPIASCVPELETALRLWEIGAPGSLPKSTAEARSASPH